MCTGHILPAPSDQEKQWKDSFEPFEIQQILMTQWVHEWDTGHPHVVKIQTLWFIIIAIKGNVLAGVHKELSFSSSTGLISS